VDFPDVNLLYRVVLSGEESVASVMWELNCSWMVPLLKAEVCIGKQFIWGFNPADEMEESCVFLLAPQ